MSKRIDRYPASDARATARHYSRKKRVSSDTNAPQTEEDRNIDSKPTRDIKKRKTTHASQSKKARLYALLFGPAANETELVSEAQCLPPARQHTVDYHRPLLLHGQQGRQSRQALLQWFDSVSTARAMPWRKAWIDPRHISDPRELRRALERRAYEVWISEVMLQQTRVVVVVDYWNRWMAKWPTIQDLATASQEDVLAAWRGLGYYSRATRIHNAAKLVASDEEMRGLLPESIAQLEGEVPGVGRYTAGAISAIVFGHAAPMVDGNVLRVLSRLLGLYGNVKTDKSLVDILWAVADELVKAVARDGSGGIAGEGGAGTPETSDRPGRWGQALMELGSTVCTAKPNCSSCPVTSACRVYSEANSVSLGKRASRGLVDMEDLCSLCDKFEDIGPGDTPPGAHRPASTIIATRGAISSKQTTLESFAFINPNAGKPARPIKRILDPGIVAEGIADYAKRFPLKTVKRSVREEEAVVCAVRCEKGRFLIHRRPQKGLLAGLWEFPSLVIDGLKAKAPKERERLARSYVLKVLKDDGQDWSSLDYKGELGSVPWLFSHLKLTMHVHLFVWKNIGTSESLGMASGVPDKTRRWTKDVEGESMGTGMRKCWYLVQEATHKYSSH